MARRALPPVSYDDDLELRGAASAPDPGHTSPMLPAAVGQDDDGAGGKVRPILENSAPTLVYMHPSGKHQLRQYAVAQGLKVKVHDLLIEALEEWGQKRGLMGPWRVEPTKPRR